MKSMDTTHCIRMIKVKKIYKYVPRIPFSVDLEFNNQIMKAICIKSSM